MSSFPSVLCPSSFKGEQGAKTKQDDRPRLGNNDRNFMDTQNVVQVSTHNTDQNLLTRLVASKTCDIECKPLADGDGLARIRQAAYRLIGEELNG